MNTFGGLAKTTNGGTSWQLQLNDTYRPKKIFMLNNDTGWVLSNEATTRLYLTTNSGQNWNLHYTFTMPGAGDIFFTDRDTGWATGGTTGIMKTTNGGSAWFTQTNPGTVAGGSKIFFIDNDRGWIGVFANRMLATTNGGINWGIQTTPANVNYSVIFTDTLNGWAGTNILIHTTDAGGPITYIGIEPNSNLIPAFNLKQNNPNPFNPSTNIRFEITKPSRVSLQIFDILGEEVDELLDYEKHSAGSYDITYEAGDDLASGIYFYRMTAWTEDKKEIFIDSKKMILIK
ncbi:MAG: T9SS type A sorting domain-containing protein [Chlorobi bacterium]|nr:T9SS type A sorting domain-containing protein [Chlorobiota bacterium]MCI0716180.1 T9SS type A sorting domain-containing protein [Chlorobiota bacterium]